MSEVATTRAEIRGAHHNRAKAKLLAAPVLAALVLAGCTGGSNAGSHTPSPRTGREASGTGTAQASPTASVTPKDATPSPTTTSSSKAEGLAGCAPYFNLVKYRNHEFEVCTAYIGNTALVALQGMYKFGNSDIGRVPSAVREHFETRFYDQPRQAVEADVDSWPKTSSFTGNKVEETIILTSLSSNLKADRALVNTQESWKVTASDGSVLHDESLHDTVRTMCRGRLPGHPLHEWAVVSNTILPKFDCIGFDRSHRIEP